MRKFLRKMIGAASDERVSALLFKMDDLEKKNDDLNEKFDNIHVSLLKSMSTLKDDMKILYKEQVQENKRLNQKFNSLKPILKIDDKESEKFIRDILSKHDHKLNMQEQHVADNLKRSNDIQRSLTNLANEVKNQSKMSEDCLERARNIFQGMGVAIAEEKSDLTSEDIQKHVRDYIVKLSTESSSL